MHHLIEPNPKHQHGQVRMLDMKPDRDTPWQGEHGRRWQEGDPSPVEILMDYHLAAEACERDPGRYRDAARQAGRARA